MYVERCLISTVERQYNIPLSEKKGKGGPPARRLSRSIFVNFCDSAEVNRSSLLCNCFMCPRKLSINILFALPCPLSSLLLVVP